MSTRAMIGIYGRPKEDRKGVIVKSYSGKEIKTNTERVQGIYSHWDGYPTGLGIELQRWAYTRRKALRLVEGGDISAIDWKTGMIHYYADRYDWVRWNTINKKYELEKDRGGCDENWEDVKPKSYYNGNEFVVNSLAGKSMIEFVYLFDDDKWRCFGSRYGHNNIIEYDMDIKYLLKWRKSDEYPKNGFRTIKSKKEIV